MISRERFEIHGSGNYGACLLLGGPGLVLPGISADQVGGYLDLLGLGGGRGGLGGARGDPDDGDCPEGLARGVGRPGKGTDSAQNGGLQIN